MPYPSKKTPELCAEILKRISEGEPLAAICRESDKPDPSTWGDWVAADEALAIAYAKARAQGFDAIAAGTLEIADDGTNDWMEKRNQDGEVIGWTLNGEHVQRSKLRIETRLKLLAKWDPKRYGERLDVGNADDKPFEVRDADRAAQVANILQALAQRRDADHDASDLV